MTVNEIIAEINHCNRTIKELEEYSDGGDIPYGCAETMRSAVSIIEDYVETLGNRQVK